MENPLFFKDNFFSVGTTEILSISEEVLGEINLHSAFGSALDVYDAGGFLMYSCNSEFFSGKWIISNVREEEVGRVKSRFSLFSKKFEYEAYDRGIFEIKSEIFSNQYEMFDESETLIASFHKASGWFSADAYSLMNHSDLLDSYELIAVVMGVHAIQKSQNS